MISERIKELRAKKGVKQTELAKALKLSRSSINAWEMGISIPSTQYIVELSKFFKVSTDYLLGLNPKESVDISFLKDSQKTIIYSLLEEFHKNHYAVDILTKNKSMLTMEDSMELDIDLSKK